MFYLTLVFNRLGKSKALQVSNVYREQDLTVLYTLKAHMQKPFKNIYVLLPVISLCRV